MQRSSLLRLPVSPYRRVFVGFSSRRLRRFARALASPPPIFRRAVADFSACRCRFFGVPLPIFLRAAADFSACRRRFFCAPLPIFRRAVADFSVRRCRSSFRAPPTFFPCGGFLRKIAPRLACTPCRTAAAPFSGRQGKESGLRFTRSGGRSFGGATRI